MGKYLFGFDLGTQGAKGVINDVAGNVIAYSYCPHEVARPKPGWAEQDAQVVWWKGFIKVAQSLLSQSGIDPGDICAIGCSGMTPCMVPLDEDGKPLHNAILYGIDNRSDREADELGQMIGAQYADTEYRPRLSAQFIGCRILWYKKNEPQLFSRTARYASASTWLAYCLTGEFAVSDCDAGAYLPMYDAGKKRWNEEICKLIGINSGQLPAVVPAYHVIGGVQQSAAKATGLKEGTPVIAGMGDSVAELFSTGAVEGETILLYGSTMLIDTVVSKPVYRDGLICLLHPMPGLYLAGGATATSASITKWFRDQFGYEELLKEKAGSVDAYAAFADMAAKIPAGAEGLVLLPYFAGERSPFQDAQAKGMLFGLTLYHSKAHIFRAILEGTAYSLNHNIDAMRQAGIEVNSIISAGGGAKNPVWVQIMSDVTGVPQRCLSVSGASRGCAYLAGYGVGVFKDTEVLRGQWVKTARVVEPDQENHAKYQQYYEIYRELYENTKQQMKKISKIAGIKEV